jgi:hypothetical protein
MRGDSKGSSPDIDKLYQLPLAEFTAARNELAKRESGAGRSAEIRALQKPSLPAWAVNQLFWKRRKTFDRVIDAAKRLRVEHGRQLSGKGAEVEAAEQRHREALRAATDDIRDLLKTAGEQDTPATMLAVTETLHGLPGRDDHGRLVKPLKPLGFEALAGLVGGGGATIARLTEVRPGRVEPARRPALGKESAKADAARRKRESQAQAKAVTAAERALRKAEVEERAARAELARAEMTLARLQRERKELQERVDQVTSRRDQASVDFDDRRRAADRAAAERERLAAQLASLKS